MGDYGSHGQNRYGKKRAEKGLTGPVRQYNKTGEYRKVRNTFLVESALADNPMATLLENPYSLQDITAEELAESTAGLKIARKRSREFQDELKEVLSEENVKRYLEENGMGTEEKELKTAKSQLLKEFYDKALTDGYDFTAQELAALLYQQQSLDSWEEVVRIFESSDNEELQNSSVIKEFYAVGLNKINRLDDSIRALEELQERGEGNIGERAGILGKVYKMAYSAETDPAKKKELLQKSIDVLEAGFSDETFAFYPGINMVYQRMEMGLKFSKPEQIQRAVAEAGLVELACLKAGGTESADYWTLATLAEAAVLSGGDPTPYLRKTLQLADATWKLGATRDSMQRFSGEMDAAIAAGNLSPELEQKYRGIQTAANKTATLLQEQYDLLEKSGKTDIPDELPITSLDETAQGVLSKGFSYGEISTFVGGNVEFGGQLQSHVVNRWDAQVAKGLVEQLGLDTISSVEEFNDAVDPFIRMRYDTAPLEDLHSDAHGVYDRQIQGALTTMGVAFGWDEKAKALRAKNDPDTRTNIMMDFYLGKGDCRQHAHTKQLLFDVWKSEQLNKKLKQLSDDVSGRTPLPASDRVRIKKEVDDLIDTRMLVLDARVSSQVKMKGLYDSETDTQGRHILSDQVEAVEDHTLNAIVKMDRSSGSIASMRLRDSFYQQHYSFGDGYVDPADFLAGGLKAGTVEAVSADGKIVRTPVLLTPVSYSGDREIKNKHNDDLGGPTFRGIPVKQLEGDDGRLATRFFEGGTAKAVDAFWQLVGAPVAVSS